MKIRVISGVLFGLLTLISTVSGQNILVNPGFETGSLDPWFHSHGIGSEDWNITDSDAHTGSFSATTVGPNTIKQDFNPIPVRDITKVSLWVKSTPESYFYGSSLNYYGFTFRFADSPSSCGWSGIRITPETWNFQDLTPFLSTAPDDWSLVSFEIDGGSYGIRTLIDDVEIMREPAPAAHVLCVGVRDYEDNLRGDIASERVRQALTKFGCVKTAVNLRLTMESADYPDQFNRGTLISMINLMRDRVQLGESFIFYFASHGGFDTAGDELAVEAQDNAKYSTRRILTTGDERLGLSRRLFAWEENMSDDGLHSLFSDEKWQSVNKLFIIDCCYSGGFMGTAPLGDTGDLTTLSKSAVIASSPEGDFGYANWDDIVQGNVHNLGTALVEVLEEPPLGDYISYEELWHKIEEKGEQFQGSWGRITGFPDNLDADIEVVFNPIQYASEDFQVTLGIPEPGILTLLAAGGLIFLLRYKR